jgi:hypothetical protein
MRRRVCWFPDRDVLVGCSCDYLDPYLPWSGVKNTGKGVSLSTHGFRGVTRLKGYNMRLPK